MYALETIARYKPRFIPHHFQVLEGGQSRFRVLDSDTPLTLNEVAGYMREHFSQVVERADVRTTLAIILEDPKYWDMSEVLNQSGLIREMPIPEFKAPELFKEKLHQLGWLFNCSEYVQRELDKAEQDLPNKPEAPANRQGLEILGFMEAPLHPKVKKIFLGMLMSNVAYLALAMLLPDHANREIFDELLDLAIAGEMGNLKYMAGLAVIVGVSLPSGVEPLDFKTLDEEYKAVAAKRRAHGAA